MESACDGQFNKINNNLLFTASRQNKISFNIVFRPKEEIKHIGNIAKDITAAKMTDTIESLTLFYNSGVYTLSKQQSNEIKETCVAVEGYQSYKIIVTGHTDNVPYKTGKTNWELSAQRAAEVINALIEVGISKESVSASFHSDTRSCSDYNLERNRERRVEILITIP